MQHRHVRRSTLTTRSRPVPLVGLILVAVLATLLGGQSAANAVTAYEITSQWASGTGSSVKTGDTVSAEWRVSINDDGAAPDNEPVDNVTFTATATAGTFVSVPDACRTSGVSPPSSLSADKKTLVCNVGTKNEGTSVFVSSPIKVTGNASQQLSVSGTIGGHTATPGQLPINNPFGMDILWDTSVPSTQTGNDRDFRFPWTIFHNTGAAPGPSSVTYTLTVNNSTADGMEVIAPGCRPFSLGSASGHPWSDPTKPADQRAPYPATCTLTRVGGAGTGTATFQLTISGIDYSQTQVPTKDSTGALLPTDKVAVATGEVLIRVLNPPSVGSITLTSNAPSYTPAGGGTAAADDSSNNTSQGNWTSGFQTGGWNYGSVGNPGSAWSDTLRVSPGTVVRSNSTLIYPNGPGTWTNSAICQTVDSQYAEFVDAGFFSGTNTNVVAPPAGSVYRYYVSASPLADPNGFQCGNASANWTTTKPADLSTVRAVMVSYPWTADLKAAARVGLWMDVRIKPTTPIGQDVWEFGGYANSTTAAVPVPGVGTWFYPNRGTSGAVPTGATATPGTRYPWAFGQRDILRVVGARPVISKDATPLTAQPGDAISYTLTYSAQGNATATPNSNAYTVVDTLPVGMTYVPGSASPAPTITTSGGQQTLTWSFTSIPVNVNRTLTYQATIPTSATPGSAHTNTATSSVDGQTSPEASATVRVVNDGYTRVAKTADQAYIPNVSGNGNGSASWTVTVSSEDPTTQQFTDVIDVLPYNGDGRGTDFDGSYVLSGPISAAGATVYYTTAAPGSVSMDPAAAANGSAGSVTGNTVGWTTTFTPNATAVRVIGGTLSSGASRSFTVPYTTTGMSARDTLVNTTEARAEHTRLLMRTSDSVTVATKYSASLKKYVRDPDDAMVWLDANDPASYARYSVGDTVRYRVAVTNTGQTELDDIAVTDDLQPLLGGYTIGTLASGDTDYHEYDVVLTAAMGSQVVNTACASAPQPADASGPVEINCDPAGINVVNHPDVEVSKSADPASGTEVDPDDIVTYRVSFKNTGDTPAVVDYTDELAGVLDDADYVTGSISGTNGVTGAYSSADQSILMSGTVPAGQTAVVEYKVKVKALGSGDGLLANFVVPTGEEPPTTCEADNPLCTEHPLGGKLEVEKSADPASGTEVNPGDALTYTLTFKNTGYSPVAVDHVDHLAGVLDDATWTSGPTTSNPALNAVRTGDEIAITGNVPAGATYTVSYTVTVKSSGDTFGDGLLKNFLRPEGVTPPDDCEPTDDLCTEHPIPGKLVLEKSSDPASGTPVVRGSTINYTLTFRNVGGAPVTVDHTDDLSKLLDDATITTQPTATGGLTVTPSPLGSATSFDVTGSLTGGQTATVTYSATVKMTDLGDGQLDNFLVKHGDTPPDECVPDPDEDPTCTTHPVPSDLVVTKSADPASTTPVVAGQVVTYTLTFVNGGGAPAAVDHTDYLAKVLDDADLVAGSLTAGSGLTATLAGDGQSFTVTGSVGGGQTRTVTYQVKVKDAGYGDGQLDNFVRETGTNPPATCEPTDTLCTTHPVPGNLTVVKDSDPASGTAVALGDVVTYTLTFTNTGAQASPVDYTDDLTEALDDATVEGQPTISGNAHGLSASSVSGGKFTVTGDLDAESTVQITYSLRVKTSNLGDGSLDNFVVKTGDTPPTTCQTGQPLCTEHPVAGNLTVEKSSDPANGSEVAPGSDITYTVTFKNTGGLASPVDYTDLLEEVLDDATLTAGPTSSDPSLVATLAGDGKSFSVVGDLAGGSTVTVVYTVKVNADSFGDGKLDNYVVKTGDNPPATCESDNRLCTEHTVPGNLSVVKSSDPTSGTAVLPGDDIDYTVTFKNTGGLASSVDYTDLLDEVLDDATLTAGPTSSDPSLVATLAGDGKSFSVVGDLAGGKTVTVTYTVKVNADSFGDGQLDNYVVKTGDNPPATCESDNPLCTEHPVPKDLTVTKTSDPVSGTQVDPGEVVKYTLTFANGGGAPADVDYTDYLAALLDDADITSDPVSSNSDLSVAPSPLGSASSFTVTGSVPGGTSYTVTYEATVKDSGFGDGQLDNFVRPTTDTPPTPGEECQSGDPLCTSHPVPGNLSVVKDSDPVSGTVVEPGQDVDYTLTFTNTGGQAVDVDYTDYLAELLDDADITSDPVSSDPSLTVDPTPFSGDHFTVTGSLGSEKTVTVTYTAKVKTSGFGDGKLTNVVTEGDEPPGPCLTGNPLCTEHPVAGDLEVTKSSDPVSGTSVEPGDVIDYTLTFRNTGGTAVAVDHTDYLTKVLDDATLTGGPTSSDPTALAVAMAGDGQSFRVTGQVGTESVVTVTYQVTVKDDGFGDGFLLNVVRPGTETPPETCEPTDELCTEHPVPGILDVAKSSDPVSGTEVKANEEITYRLTFTNSGGRPVAVDHTDYLSKVLDDATVTAQPAIVGAAHGLSTTAISGGQFTVSGDLTAGSTVVVEYKVKVKATDRGDSILDNFLMPGDEEPPATCVPAVTDCTTHPVGEFAVSKSVDPASGSTVIPGQTLTYRVSFANTGATTTPVDYSDLLAGVLDDATLTSDPTFVGGDANGLAITPDPFSGDRIDVDGVLAAGKTSVVTYQVKVKESAADRGDQVLGNFVVEGTDDPPTTCEDTNDLCTENPVGEFAVTKSSDPASGTVLKTGDEVTYTLTFANVGAASAAVDYTDHLGKVLDDATVVSAPAFDGPAGGLSVTSVAGGKFTVSGDLAGGTTVKVVYTVKVKAAADRGDSLLDNFLVKGSGEPPATCEEDTPLCTEHPVGELAVAKSVDPASFSTVTAGQVLTYRLTFTNRGAVDATVDYTDHLAKVLDDATIASAPAFVGSPAGLSVSGVSDEKFTVSGELTKGSTAIVEYKVKVKAAADRGDDVLDNFLVHGDDEPPTQCVPADRRAARAVETTEGNLCTENPVGDFSVTKTSDPKAGTKVKDGDTVTYTLTFAHTGATTHAVDYTDYLAKVLDDAILTKDPVIEGEAHGLSVSEVADQKFTVSGDLEARSTVKVTYSVKVHETGNGDLALTNFLVEGDDNPPSRCTSTTPLCTEHPVTVPKPDVEAGGGGILEGALPNTGGPVFALLLAGLLAALVGALMVGARRRREE